MLLLCSYLKSCLNIQNFQKSYKQIKIDDKKETKLFSIIRTCQDIKLFDAI